MANTGDGEPPAPADGHDAARVGEGLGRGSDVGGGAPAHGSEVDDYSAASAANKAPAPASSGVPTLRSLQVNESCGGSIELRRDVLHPLGRHVLLKEHDPGDVATKPACRECIVKKDRYANR